MAYILGQDCELHMGTDGGGDGFSNVGNVQDGRMIEESEVKEIRGIGSENALSMRAGIFRVSGNCSYILKDSGILTYVERSANGRLSEVSFRGGSVQATSQGYNLHKYCKIDSLNLECAAGGEVMAGVDWKGRSYTPVATQLPTLSQGNNKAFEWYGVSMSGIGAAGLGGELGQGGSNLQPVQFSLRIENNTEWLPVIGGTDRLADYIREGDQRISLALRVLIPPSTDISADGLDVVGTVTLTLTNGTQTVTIQLNNLLAGQVEKPLRAGDAVIHGCTYGVQSFGIS